MQRPVRNLLVFFARPILLLQVGPDIRLIQQHIGIPLSAHKTPILLGLPSAPCPRPQSG